MSSYIHFFVRKHNEFAPIGTYGRSTCVYELFDHRAPWEQIAPVNYEMLNRVKDDLREKMTENDAAISNAHKRIALIPSFNNSIEDKMDALLEEEAAMEGLTERRKELDSARAFIGFLYDILDAVEYGNDDSLKSTEYLYVGMECGSSVSERNIAE